MGFLEDHLGAGTWRAALVIGVLTAGCGADEERSAGPGAGSTQTVTAPGATQAVGGPGDTQTST
ncbi:MAG: hypothetical protein M3389_14930, partial [Actinomycetota bacterium]|nr:hypothetical protein [Actinomycetota bacterium]